MFVTIKPQKDYLNKKSAFSADMNTQSSSPDGHFNITSPFNLRKTIATLYLPTDGQSSSRRPVNI